jgi:hypothetical protein
MIRCKDSVRFAILRSEIYNLFPGLTVMFARQGVDCWITCGTEAHGPDDPHTNGYAIDIRSKHLPTLDAKYKLLDQMRVFCAEKYTILLENVGLEQEHFHIQVKKGTWQQAMKGETDVPRIG